MSTLQNGASPCCRVGELPSLETLLVIATRFSDRCYICRWIVVNQGSRTDLLNPLPIGGVEISPETQLRHLWSHPDALGDSSSREVHK